MALSYCASSAPPGWSGGGAPDLSAIAPPGSHTAHFYSGTTQLVAEVGQRLLSALLAGGAALVIAEQSHCRSLSEFLASRGLDLERSSREGRWLALDASRTLTEIMAGEIADPSLFSSLIADIIGRLASAIAANGAIGSPIAVYNEMAAILWRDGNRSAVDEMELVWSGLSRAHALHVSCGWPLRLFAGSADALAVEQICSGHSHVSPSLGYTALSEEQRRRGGFLWQLKANRVLENVSMISRQTLDFYRGDNSPAWLSVPEAAEEVLAIYRLPLTRREIDIRTSLRSGLRLHWPHGECKHILSSLIANALDASSDGATIFLGAWETHHPLTGAPGVRLVVGDQGIGIAPELVPRVFTPFFTARKDISIGLGLWSIKVLIEKRGGAIRCRSRVRRPSGTLMMAFLPTEPVSLAA